MADDEFNYSDYEDCNEDKSVSLQMSNVSNTYYLLLELTDLYIKIDIPKHKAFFSLHKPSGINLCDFDNFPKLIGEHIQEIQVVIDANLYNQIEDDESIIQLLERLTENFILLMKSLSYWDEKLNFTNTTNLSFAIRELCSFYNITYNYLKNERVDFLRQNYPFTYNTVLFTN
jgi:hypothetical protein